MSIDHQFLEHCRSVVERNMERVATLGGWPAHIDVRRSLLGRLPTLEPGSKAPGFDAGIACCLDLIPRHRQRLAATLHANYSEEAVEQVRRETSGFMSLNSESAWWLAASAICEEDGVDAGTFRSQFDDAHMSLSDVGERHVLAAEGFLAMKSGFDLQEGIAWATSNNGILAAYIAGHSLVARQVGDTFELWYANEGHGLKRLAEYSNRSDFDRALAIVKRHLAR